MAALGLLGAGCGNEASFETDPDPSGKADHSGGFEDDTCLFGDWWPSVVNSGDFEFGPGEILTSESYLDELTEMQILEGMQDQGSVTLEDAFDYTDEASFYVSTMVSLYSDHDAFTVYEFHAGENPMGFVFAKDSLELVARIGDDSIYDCSVHEGGVPEGGSCLLDGAFQAVGDWDSFSSWTFEFYGGRLVNSFTDDLPPWEWRTTHIEDPLTGLHTLVQVTDASDAIVSTNLHFRLDGCSEDGTPLVSVEGAYTVTTDAAGSLSSAHDVSIITQP